MSIAATSENAAHLLRRAAWGGTPEEIDAVASRGIEASVEALLDPGPAPNAGSPYRMDTGEVAFYDEAFRLWWYRLAATSPTPAIERLAWFWHGHFATSVDKVGYPDLLHTQMVTLRRHGLGRIDDLLLAMINDAAMNVYLDLHLSEVGNVNENFARELLELFSMGQGQGYTQTDVEQAARALTGYGFVEDMALFRPLASQLRPELHDFGIKTFLGRSGRFTAVDIVAAIVETNQCHRFIAGRLWHRYAGTEPDADVLTELADVLAERLLIGDVLGAILKHEAFYSDEVKNGLVAQPVELLTRTFRNFGLDILDVTSTPIEELEQQAESDDGDSWRKWAVLWLSEEMGQRPAHPPNVSGWGHNEFWLDTNGSSARVRVGREIAFLVAEGDNDVSRRLRELANKPRNLAEAVLRQFGLVEWSATTMDALIVAARTGSGADAVMLTVATAFGSPEVALA